MPIQGVAAMDYVHAGQSLTVPPNATLGLDYLAACLHETITSGARETVVTIGPEQSEITDGKVVRQRMDCDGSNLQLTAAQSDAGGVAVYRSTRESDKPKLTLRSTVPVITAKAAEPMTLERLDKPEAARTVTLTTTGQRAMADLASAPLSAGGTYRLTQGSHSEIVRIDAQATGGPAPLVVRLLPF